MSLTLPKSFKELYKISKFVYKESFLEGYLDSSGPQKDAFLNKVKKNSRTVNRNAIGMKILSGFYMLLLNYTIVIVLLEFQESLSSINIYNFNRILTAMASSTSILFGMQLIFMYTFGMTSLIGFFGGKAFKWLETLPLNDKELKTVIFLTFFRSIDIQILTLLLSFPIITLIISHSWIAFFVAFIVNILHIMFCISIMTFLSNFMIKKVFSVGGISKIKTVLRVVIMVAYMIAAMSLSIIFNFLQDWIQDIFNQSLTTWKIGIILTYIFSFIFYPFSLTLLYSLSLFPLEKIYISLSWPVIIGFILSAIIIWFLFKKAIKIMRSITKEIEIDSVRSKKSDLSDPIFRKLKPVKAISTKEIKFISRNFSTMMYFLLPIIWPIFTILLPVIFEDSPFLSIGIINIMQFMYVGLSYSFVLQAVTGSESDSGELLQTLPTRTADIYKGKRNVILAVMNSTLIIPMIISIFIIQEPIQIILLNIISVIIITFYESEFVLMLYSLFFGKIRGKYSLQMINPKNKIIKVIVGVILIYVTAYIPLIITESLKIISQQDIYSIYIFQIVISLSIFIPIRLFAHRMFNWDGKPSKILDNPIMSVTVMLFVYFMYLLITPLLMAFLGIYNFLPREIWGLIEFLGIFMVLSILFFIIVPYGFGLPTVNESFRTYLTNIRLNNPRMFGRNMVLGIITALTILISSFLVVFTSGYFVLDQKTILPPDSYSLITMLIPGIFEEIAFRGIILTLLLKKFSKKTSIILSSVLFGVFHLVNILSFFIYYQISGVSFPIEIVFSVFVQVTFASVIGLYLGYLYVKTGSIIPSIVSHYLIDAFIGLFTNSPYLPDYLYFQIFIVIFGIILPGLINLPITYGITKIWKSKREIREVNQ